MKIILNSLLIAFLAYLFLPLFNSGIASEKDKDIIIHKKDIIIRSDELKAEPKKDKDAEEFKPIEKPAEEKQETPNLDIVDKYLKEGKKYEARNALSDIFINDIKAGCFLFFFCRFFNRFEFFRIFIFFRLCFKFFRTDNNIFFLNNYVFFTGNATIE